VLGVLFSNISTSITQTEFVIYILPHVRRDPPSAPDTSRRLDELYKAVRTGRSP
jgi:hypothetical protein